MKKVYQTRFGKEGNCFDACIASLFEIPLESVPHFNDFGEDEWFRRASIWCLNNFGVYLLSLSSESLDGFYGYMIAGVISPNHLPHVVIVKDGEVVHDPLGDRHIPTYDLARADVFFVAAEPLIDPQKIRVPYYLREI